MKKYPLSAGLDLQDGSENIEVTPGLFAKSMPFYIQAVGHFIVKPSYFTERESYNSFLLVYTQAGKGLLRYRNKSYNVIPGQLFLLDCKEYHYYETDKTKPWELLWVHFNGATAHSFFEHILKQGGPVCTLPDDSGIPDMLQRIVEANRMRSARSDILSSKWIGDILTEFLLHTMTTESGFIPAFVTETINILERNCSQKISLDGLSNELKVSKFHLAREFKKHTGYGINEYLIHLRISLAKEMLKYTNLSIEDIALQIGFNQSSHMIRAFKKEEGITPLSFRKVWRGL